MVGKTFKSGEVVPIVVMYRIQTLHQSLQQTNFPTILSKANALYLAFAEGHMKARPITIPLYNSAIFVRWSVYMFLN